MFDPNPEPENDERPTIVSSGNDGNAVTTQTQDTSKFFGGRTRADRINSASASTMRTDTPKFFDQALNQNNFEHAQRSSGGGIKKKIIIAASIIAVVGIVAIVATVIGNKVSDPETKLESLRELVTENEEQITQLYARVDGIYRGIFGPSAFMLENKEEYDIAIAELDSMEKSLDTVKKGVSGNINTDIISQQINIDEAVKGLKNTIDRDYDKSKKFIKINKDLLEAFSADNRKNAKEKLSSYDNSSLKRIFEVEDERDSLMSRYIEAGCSNNSRQECLEISGQILALNNFYNNGDIIKQFFIDEIGEFEYEGDDSVLSYFNDLSVAVKNQE